MSQAFEDLHAAIRAVPSGPWAVGVSGGADSVALLRLLVTRTDLQLHVVHLDHGWRGNESRGDADFTAHLAAQLELPCSIARASEMPQSAAWPSNREARGRAMRAALFGHVVTERHLRGVLLAHHGDDQAETIFMRLLRGSSMFTLRGMQVDASITGLRQLRPLLPVRRARLIEFLRAAGQPWRDDSSNDSLSFARNRVRRVIQRHPPLFDRLTDLSLAAGNLLTFVETAATALPTEFAVTELRRAHRLVARWRAAQWLIDRGAAPEECSAAVADRLIEMCRDAASPARQHFPGAVRVRRKAGVIAAEPAA